MTFTAWSRIFAAARAAVLLAVAAAAWRYYPELEELAERGRQAAAIAGRAAETAAAAGRGAAAGKAASAALGRAVGAAGPEAQAPAFREIRAEYYQLRALEDAAWRDGKAPAKAAAIGALAIGAAESASRAGWSLSARCLLGCLGAALLLLAVELLEHALLTRRFGAGLARLKAVLLRAAAPFYPAGEDRDELEELALAAEALDIALENSMLARIRLARETDLRLRRMKSQTRSLELTRRKVVTLVDDLDDARQELQREKLALKVTGEKLARSNKELEQFAYVASHDLKEPLRVVTSFSSLLSRRYGGELQGDARDFIAYIEQGAQRATELVTALFNYSKVTYTTRDFTAVDCGLALRKAAFNLKIAMEEKNAAVEFPAAPPPVRGDEFQLIQLFQNLLGNALKFSAGAQPRVRVTAETRGGETVFSFEDNGIGVPREHAERIFLIFQRLHTADKYPGAGIGLALCKKIAENHGGRIWVEDAAGGGSVFRVAFPALAAAARENGEGK